MPASRNLELARIFAEIADFLEIKEESTFRINAYRRAARALESLGEDIAVIAERGGLRGVGGIGAGLAQRIEEYLKSGTVAYHDELQREIPRGLSELMTLPEIGPKTARLLYEHLGISDIDALERAARAGQIRRLPRMGARTEENILHGIERRRRQTTRHGLGAVLPYAQVIVEALGRVPGAEATSLAGSIRRMRDTIADIDVVVATRAPEPVMDTFTALPQVAQVLSRGPTRSSVILGRAGVQCDVRAVDPEAYGAALQYFTGSKDHNVQLRELGVRRGLKINEYGVFRVADDARIAGRAEEDVYRALDLPWVPPEIREGRGELELAQRGALPALATVQDLHGDLHMHTVWSDGQDTVDAMARAAKARGYEYICVTDHSQSLKFAGGVAAEALRDHADAAARAGDRVGIHVLLGAEVEILADGSLDYPDDVLASLDLVIGSVHSRMQMPRDALTRRVLRALEHPHLDMLGHPTGRLIGEREPMDLDMEAVVECARRTETVLEVNASPERLDLRDAHVRLARDRGVLLAINSDAHRTEHLAHIVYGVGTARRGWAEAKDVVNAWPWRRLLDFLGR